VIECHQLHTRSKEILCSNALGQSADLWTELLVAFPDSKACPVETAPARFWKIDADTLHGIFEGMGLPQPVILKHSTAINTLLLQHRENLRTVFQVFFY
jgi:hypothetical protein